MSRIPHQIFELRPLKTVELSPPDYKISHQELIDSYLEKEVKVRITITLMILGCAL
jgi:hypothetical protein